MAESIIRDFHAHIYFDADQLDRARRVAEAAHERFGVPVGRFHTGPVGPHPRGSCQLTVRPEQFGDFAQWIALNRDGLTILLIEHVMRAVTALASRILVLHHGAAIAEGNPEQVLRDPAVVESYLGAESL